MISKSIKQWLKTQHKELRVATTIEQASITPKSGKKIRIYAIQVSQMVITDLTATLRASLSFGTGGVSDSSKVLLSYGQFKAGDAGSFTLSGLNVVGEADEPITLTNATFSNGAVITRAVVYYNEE